MVEFACVILNSLYSGRMADENSEPLCAEVPEQRSGNEMD